MLKLTAIGLLAVQLQVASAQPAGNAAEAIRLPSAHSEPERYRGRPLLIVLEQYVLFCIGHGNADQGLVASKVVQRVWGGNADWQATVRRVLQLPASIDDAIRAKWEKNQQIAQAAGTSLLPVQFAKLFVDANFAPLIEKTN